MKNLGRIIKENLVMVSMITIMILIATGTIFTWLNKRKIVETTLLKSQAEEVKQRLDMIFSSHLRQIDLGLRGYALTKSEQLLDPLKTGIRANELNLQKLDSLLRIQKLDTSFAKFNKIKKGISDYIKYSMLMKKEAEIDSMKQFVVMLNKDIGYDLWRVFAPFSASHIIYEDAVIKKAQSDYEAALNRNIFIQIILVLIGFPSLGFVIYVTRKDVKDRRKLIIELDENNRKYLFDPGTELTVKNPKEVVENSIRNFKKASEFVKGITSKNYQVQWVDLDQGNAVKNSNTLAGELVKMRDQMILAKQEDERRLWVNEGLAKFSQLVRNHQANLTKLSEEVIRFLAQYINAQQGGLFVLNDETDTEKFLELKACYAFDKKKFITKRIEIGDGIIGQTYLEGEAVVLREVPSDYVEITSGLGHATPTCLCIIPLKYNDKIEAVLELASFHFFESYQMDFLEKAGEFVAAAIIGAKVTSRMKILLDQSQNQSEILHAQEEEMRQNMEEMQATQEEMARKEKEIGKVLDQSIENEELLKAKITEINRIEEANKKQTDAMLKEMDQNRKIMSQVIEELPEKIFLKDEEGRMILLNSAIAAGYKKSVSELIGKSDFDLFPKEIAATFWAKEKEIITTGKPLTMYEDFPDASGQIRNLYTVKMPFHFPGTKKIGILGYQVDITEIKRMENKVMDAEVAIQKKSEESLKYMKNYQQTLLNILDQLPHKVFLKDKDGKMALANTIVAKAHNMSVDELIGKSDFDFVDAKTAQDWRNQELAIIEKGSETYIFDETLHNKTKTLKSTKMAFYIPHLNQTGLLGIQTDITELQELKKQAAKHKS